MPRGFERRLARIEESIPVPMTAERFLTLARQHGNRTGVDVHAAIATLAKDLSDAELHSITAAFERIAFGSDTAARDAAKREAFAAAGYCPDLDKQYGNEANGGS